MKFRNSSATGFPDIEAMLLAKSVLLLATMLYVGQGQTIEDTHNILTTVLSGYNSDVRPANNQSRPVQVNVVMELVNIKEFDDVTEQISLLLILYLEWTDHRLAWDPAQFNGTTSVNIPVTKIWRPNLILTSPVGKVIPVGSAQDWAVARCFHTGRIMWNAADTITSSCSVDISLFPFDEQNCDLNFIPWGYTSHEIMLISVENKVRQTFYSPNGGWMLLNSSVNADDVLNGYFSTYSVVLHLRRRSIFFVVNAVLPVIFISCLNVLVFFVPVECGERVSYAVTVFLALAVLMTIVGENMPKNSKHMAIICYFLLANVGHSTVICFETMICLHTYYREGPVPNMLSRLFPSKICCALNRNLEKTHVTDEELMQKTGENGDVKGQNIGKDDLTMKDVQKHEITWRDVSYKLDKIFGLSAIVLLLIFIIIFILVTARDK